MSERDRRLAHEIAAGVLRGRAELDRRLQALVSAPWERVPEDLRDILRLGAYQLIQLDRVPRYAVVQTAVTLAAQTAGRRSGAMVNAVLRRIERGPEPDGGEAAGSHPGWLVSRWESRFGPARTAALLRHNDRRPPLVLQPINWSARRLTDEISASGTPAKPAPGNRGIEVQAHRVRDLPGYQAGAFIVQDPAQAAVLEYARIPAGALVWDGCAAPGGKAITLARDCRVIASDASLARTQKLRETAARIGSPLLIAVADARSAPLPEEAADAVLLDAPCSATGTMARHPDARWRLTPRRIERFTRLQGELLDGMAPVVKKGGLLIYATCSLEAEENEDQVERFLARHPSFERTADDLQVFPPDAGTDGAYAARLRRAA